MSDADPGVGSAAVDRPKAGGVRRRASFRLQTFLSRDFLRYLGPGFIVTVGFIDPGNWATNIAAGSRFGYRLLWVVGLATLILILLQHLSARIGIVSGHSLAYNVKQRFSQPWVALFGSTIVLACMATDLAELLGGALGFNLLFGLPLWLGAGITVALKVGLIMGGRYHRIERLIVVFIAVIAACYLVELHLVDPDWKAAGAGLSVPHVDRASILTALGVLGAVVMPHNIYLHSNVILSRDWSGDEAKRRRLLSYELGDTVLSMGLGWILNSAMIVVAAAVFFRHGVRVSELGQASATLEPLVGNLSRFLFSLALLLAGLGSSITSSMTEANVITAFLGRPEDPRTRLYRFSLFATALPALVIISVGPDPFSVLIFSQVVLSIQLPLTIIPLLLVAADRRIMGKYASGRAERSLVVAAGAIVIFLNAYLLFKTATG